MNKTSQLTLGEIEIIKTQACDLIKQVIKKVELDTGMVCNDISFFLVNEDEENEDYDVNMRLEIKHKSDLGID